MRQTRGTGWREEQAERAPVGMRIEETAARFNEVEKAIRQMIPPSEVAAVADNIGTYISAINTIYNNTGTIGESDGDIQISLNQGHAPTATTSRSCASGCRAVSPA